MDHSPVVALVYDDDAYVEAGGAAIGLMGRQVAGKAFLEAYLKHGRLSEMAAIVKARDSSAALVQAWRDGARPAEPARTLRLIGRGELYETLLDGRVPAVLHFPQPPDPALAWLRQQARPHAFSLTGVTHTLCSAEAVTLLRALVTAPFEPYDTLVCTSRAVAAMVHEVTSAYSEHLLERFGRPATKGVASESPARVIIPLGVDVDRFAPASPAERAEARRSMGIGEDQVAILYVGRLSHHAKAHPFPMFRGVAEAARASGRNVHLILAGWAAHPAVLDAFQSGAGQLAPRCAHVVPGRPGRARSPRGVACGGRVRFCFGQHPGNIWTFGGRGDGEWSAGRRLRLERIPRPGRRRPNRLSGADGDGR